MIEKADFRLIEKPLIAFYYNRPMPKGKGGVQKFTIFTSKKGGLTAMIYVTADLHGDATRLRTKEIRRLKKGDTLIVWRFWVSLAGYAKKKKNF